MEIAIGRSLKQEATTYRSGGSSLTYIKYIYPEIDQKAYIIAREIAKRLKKAPELEDLARYTFHLIATH